MAEHPRVFCHIGLLFNEPLWHCQGCSLASHPKKFSARAAMTKYCDSANRTDRMPCETKDKGLAVNKMVPSDIRCVHCDMAFAQDRSRTNRFPLLLMRK